jgi:hypothetical protein
MWPVLVIRLMYNHRIERTRLTGTKGRLHSSSLSSEGNVLAKPEMQEQRTRHFIPVLSYKLPLALYYYTNPASVAISLHITSTNCLPTTLPY